MEVARLGRRAGDSVILGWLVLRDRWATIAMLIGFAALILLGVTTSSIGIGSLSQDPDHPLARGLGQPQWIRSDEYNIWSPVWLSIMTTGGAPTLSPLGAAGDLAHRYSSGGLFETIVFFPSLLLRSGTFLPQNMVFSASWWLPMILLFLALPVWMQRLGGSRRLGWLAAFLIAFCPAVAWWSFGPVTAFSFPIAGCALLLVAYEAMRDRRWVVFGFAAVGSGILLASIPTLYAPWAIVLAVPTLLATVAWILTRDGRWRDRLVPVASVGIVALILAAGTLWENRVALTALAGTVYPGQRRSSSVAQSFGMLFGAPGFSAFSAGDPVTSNASELSTAFTVCAVWAVILLVAVRFTGRWYTHLPTIVIGFATVLWLGWSTVNTGSIGARIPVLDLVPSYRSAQVVGILATLLACMLLGSPLRIGRLRAALIAAATSALVTAFAVSSLQSEAAPFMPTWLVIASAVGVATAVFAVTMAPRSLWSIALAGALAFATVATAQPVLAGTGDLRASPTATAMRSRGVTARAHGSLWVADSSSFNSLMLANAVPSLSGFQRSGPDFTEWERLDPTHEFIHSWNRGGGYLPFRFTPGKPLSILDNGFDVTIVSIDPCELIERFPEVGHIASTIPLSGVSCVVPDGSVEWQGAQINLYRVP